MLIKYMLMMGACCGLRDGNPENFGGGGTGGAMAVKEFQDKVVASTEATEKKVDTLVKNYDNLDQKTKEAFEDLTTVKNDFKGMDSDIKNVQQAIQKVNLNLELESRAAFGDPLQKLIRDENKCRSFMEQVARSVNVEAKFLGEDAGVGSTYVDEDLAKEIYDLLYEYGAWSTLGVRRVGTKTTKYPISTARPKAGFVLTEGNPIPEDNTKAGQSKDLSLEVIAVLVNVSLQLLKDGEFNIAGDLISDMVQAINERADFSFFQGDGTTDADHGGFTGLFNFGTATVAEAGRTNIGATKYTDWLKCLTSVAPAVLQRNPKWWMHPTSLAASLGVKDDNGRSIFLTATEAPTNSGIGSILGYAVNMVGAAPSANAANAQVAAFGDPDNYRVAVQNQILVEESDHAYWTQLKRSFRGYTRMAGRGMLAEGTSVLTLPTL